MDEFAEVYSLEYCANRRYWRWHDIGVSTSFAGVGHTYKGYLSKIKEFDNNFPEGFAQEFARWISTDERRWHTMKPKSLEHLVTDIFRSTYHPAEVLHVGQPDEGGVDEVFVESESKKWLIQVKRREKAKRGEPVDTVCNLIGTMVDKDSLHGIIVSTADHFTYKAYEYVQRQREKGFFIELIDKGKLNRMLDSVLPSRPWLNVLEKEYPTLAREFDKAIPEHLELDSA